MAYNIGADVHNADWLKKTWDFHGTPEEQAEQILHYRGYGTPAEQLASFLTLPAAKAMPAAVRRALLARGLRL